MLPGGPMSRHATHGFAVAQCRTATDDAAFLVRAIAFR